jgi:hypothetical protein
MSLMNERWSCDKACQEMVGELMIEIGIKMSLIQGSLKMNLKRVVQLEIEGAKSEQ